MHCIHKKEFTLGDFSWEHLKPSGLAILENLIHELNFWRSRYLATKEKEDWWQLIQLLPASFDQKRTIQLNYQVLKSMYFARKDHKLDEWRMLCRWIEALPYFKEIILEE